MRLEDYFDHASTAPMDLRVLEAVREAQCLVGNSSSLHQWGQNAAAAVESARIQVARAIQADAPEQVIFTATATEADNLVLGSFDRVAVSPLEHSAIRQPALARGAEFLGNVGFHIALPKGGADLVSIIGVSNETGGEPSFEEPACLLHRDHSQTLASGPVQAEDADFITLSSHKVGGPLGAACLYARDPLLLRPMILGGGHEWGLRSGTLNVPSIVGFGLAAELASQEWEVREAHARRLRNILKGEVEGLGVTWIEAPSQANRIASLCLHDVLAEAVVLELDRLGFAVSAGPACSSHSTEPSPTLIALGLSPEEARATIRISFGPCNTSESTNRLASALRQAVEGLRRSRLGH